MGLGLAIAGAAVRHAGHDHWALFLWIIGALFFLLGAAIFVGNMVERTQIYLEKRRRKERRDMERAEHNNLKVERDAQHKRMTRELQSIVHGTAIELRYDPDSTSNFIHIRVENNGPTDRFIADVEEIEGSESPQKLPWGIKWRGQQEEAKREIVSGHGWQLDLCEAFPPMDGPVVNSTKRGWFKFYSTTLPTKGWPIYPGPREVRIPDGTDAEMEVALSHHDPYDDVLVLKMHVSGTESPVSASTTKRVRLGFNRPHKEIREGDSLTIAQVRERVFVEVDDWPTGPSPAAATLTSTPSPESTPDTEGSQPQ